MKIRTKIIVLLSCLTALFLSALMLGRRIETKRSEAMLAEISQDKSRVFDRLVELRGKSVKNLAFDYSYWDEMVAFEKSGDPAWARINLEAALATFDANAVWVYDPGLRLVYSYNNLGARDLGELPVDKTLLARFLKKDSFPHLYANTEHGLLEIFGAPIQPSSDAARKTVPQGYFFAARVWNEDYLQELSTLSGAKVSFVNRAELKSETSKAGSHEQVVFVREFKDIAGEPLMTLRMSGKSPGLEQVAGLSRIFMASLIAFSITIMILLFLALVLWVNHPLKLLSQALLTESPGALAKLEGKGDEFSQLAGLIDNFFRQEEELKLQNVILSTQQEASIDGILVVDEAGKILSFNRRFIELWEIPESLVVSRSEPAARQLVLDKLTEPEQFVAKVQRLYGQRQEKSREEIPLKDGRTFDRYSAPMWGAGGKYYGRVWYFRDITERKRAEEALRESENRYRSLFENMLEGFAYCRMIFDDRGDPQDWVYLEVNSAFEKLTGLKNVVGRKVTEAIPSLKESNPELFQIYGKVASAGQPTEFDTFVAPLERWLHIAAFRPAPDCFVAVFQNITERKRAEEALRQSEARYRLLAENATDMIWTMDLNLRFTYVSPSAKTLRGFTAEESMPQTLDEIVVPGSIKTAADAFQDTMAQEKISKDLNRTRTMELELKRKDGSTIWTENAMRLLRGEDNEAVGIIGITRDITARKRAEEALRRSETKFRALYDTTSDAVMLLDKKGFFDCNQATLAIFGFATKEEFCSKHPAEVSPPRQPDGTDSLTLANSRIATAMEKGSLQFEWLHKRADTGEAFPAEVRFSAMELDGKPVVQALVRDITERRRMEQALQQTNDELERKVAERTEKLAGSLQEKEVLLREVYHRVKNNLQIISSLLKLQSSVVGNDQARAAFQETQERVRAMALVHEKLYQSADLAKIDFGAYIQSLVQNLVRAYVAEPGAVELKVLVDPVWLGLDTAIPCSLIVNELVSNSLKHAFPDRSPARKNELAVTLAAKSGNRFTLTVADNGRGLPEEMDLKNAKSLGLQLVLMLVEQLGGKIKVGREGGARFELEFSELKYKERK